MARSRSKEEMHSLLLERMALRKPRKHGLAGILLVVGWVLAVLRASLAVQIVIHALRALEALRWPGS